MGKECWQLKQESFTNCFIRKGSLPCRAPDCLVEVKIRELEGEGIKIDGWWKNMLPHSTCRISSLSQDNEEYLEREDVPSFTRLKGYFSIERMGEKEEPLVPVPEFERRCNAFVEEVSTTVKPKYPNLIIIPVNETQAGLEMPSLTNELSEKVQQKLKGEELEEYEQVSKKSLKEAEEISRKADIESATANRAVVVIVPKSDGLEEETFRAAEEVKEIAVKYEVKVDQSEVIPRGCSSPSVFLDILFENKEKGEISCSI